MIYLIGIMWLLLGVIGAIDYINFVKIRSLVFEIGDILFIIVTLCGELLNALMVIIPSEILYKKL